MGLKLRHKTEGGSGGKRGHSNMDHWVYTEELKAAARIGRRLQGKKLVRETLAGKNEERRDRDQYHGRI